MLYAVAVFAPLVGSAIAGLLGFRLSWGLLGSETALFRAFLPTPARLRAYLKGRWHGVGHNPLGALSVLALLILLAVQLGTGLIMPLVAQNADLTDDFENRLKAQRKKST